MSKLTIVEGMKLKKRMHVRLEELRKKIAENAVQYDNEKPVYGSSLEEHRQQVQKWIQAHHDLVMKIEQITIAIQKTNLVTDVEISVGGLPLKKSIAQWILRRQTLAGYEKACYASLSDRGLRDKEVLQSDQKTRSTVHVYRHFDPVERDQKVDIYQHEPSVIDSKLEVVNATTFLVEEVEVTE